MDHKKEYDRWRDHPDVGNALKKELDAIKGDEDAIRERFTGALSFGTGGLRGLIGAGTMRLNIHTVKRATQGLAGYIRKKGLPAPAVAVAYDSRHYSDVFALEASLVLAANGIKAYLFESLRPTPELSFAVRHLGCCAGVVITASHNPPEYNGYKVYGPDGGQITQKTANGITDEITKLDLFDDVKSISEKKAKKQGLIVAIGEAVDRAYLSEVAALAAGVNDDRPGDIRIVYTPLHGAGLKPVTAALKMRGYENVFLVEPQTAPDGDFPTVRTPDPSDRGAYEEAIKLAEQCRADLILATDPDCDRIGVAQKNKTGAYLTLSGNDIGALLTHFVLSAKDTVTAKDAVVKTIVTSGFGAAIAGKFGATIFDTLTGFKYIGEKIEEFERTGAYDFAFGYEESCGYLAGTFVRDKDAVIAAVLIADMAAFYLKKGMTLFDALDALSGEYGFYDDELISYTYEGLTGAEQIESMFRSFKDSGALIKAFDDIEMLEDYTGRKRLAVKTGAAEPIELPCSDVVKLIFSDGSWFAVRPSGTEPKLKLYFSGLGATREEAAGRLRVLKDSVARFIREI